MTDDEKRTVDVLLERIETAVGALPDRAGPTGTLIAEIIQSVNGIRSLLGVVRPH